MRKDARNREINRGVQGRSAEGWQMGDRWRRETMRDEMKERLRADDEGRTELITKTGEGGNTLENERATEREDMANMTDGWQMMRENGFRERLDADRARRGP
jgi:hypothetical protein